MADEGETTGINLGIESTSLVTASSGRDVNVAALQQPIEGDKPLITLTAIRTKIVGKCISLDSSRDPKSCGISFLTI